MSARRRRTRFGRKSRLLEPGVHTGLVDRTRVGVPVAVAAESAGISARTFRDWMQRGRAERDRLDDQVLNGVENPQPDALNRPYLELFDAIMEARAQAAVRAVASVQRAAQGGFVIEETTRTCRDPETGRLVEETTIKRAAPDWRAAAWYLERQHRQMFGRNAVQVEVAGMPDTTEGLPSTEQAADLAARIIANVAALTRRQGSATDVVNAEIVETNPTP